MLELFIEHSNKTESKKTKASLSAASRVALAATSRSAASLESKTAAGLSPRVPQAPTPLKVEVPPVEKVPVEKVVDKDVIKEVPVVQRLLDLQDDKGVTALAAAAKSGNTGTVSLLLKHGANRSLCNNDKESPLLLAAICGHE